MLRYGRSFITTTVSTSSFSHHRIFAMGGIVTKNRCQYKQNRKELVDEEEHKAGYSDTINGVVTLVDSVSKTSSKNLVSLGDSVEEPKNPGSPSQTSCVEENTLLHIFDIIESPLSSFKSKITASQSLVQVCDAGKEQIGVVWRGRKVASKLVALISSCNESIQINALASVARISNNPDVTRLLVDSDILVLLKRMLNPGNCRLLQPLLLALSALAAHSDVQGQMGQQGYVPRLLKLCHATDTNVVLAATQTLGLLSQTDANCPQIVFYGGFTLLSDNARRSASAELREASQLLLGRLVHLHEAHLVGPAIRRTVRCAPPSPHAPVDARKSALG